MNEISHENYECSTIANPVPIHSATDSKYT